MLDPSAFFNAWALPFLTLVLCGCVICVVSASTKWLDAHGSFINAQTKEKIEAMEERALDSGVNMLLAWVKTHAAMIHPRIDDPVVLWGAQTALDHAGGMLAQNGASPEEVAAKLLARLPRAAVQTDTTGAKLITTPIAVGTLPPIGKIA